MESEKAELMEQRVYSGFQGLGGQGSEELLVKGH